MEQLIGTRTLNLFNKVHLHYLKLPFGKANDYQYAKKLWMCGRSWPTCYAFDLQFYNRGLMVRIGKNYRYLSISYLVDDKSIRTFEAIRV